LNIKSIDVVLLDKDSKNISLNKKKKTVLVLSPSFYWFHKEKLNIPISQAKKIAPSTFEGIIPEGNYSYYVEKVGDEYWFFAYQDEKILEKLNQLGIKPSAISKVYPAQLVLKDKNIPPIKMGNKVLINQDGTIISMPKKLVNSPSKFLNEVPLTLPKKALPLKTYSSALISEEMLFKFSIVTFLFILAYAIQVFLEKRDLAKLINAKHQLIQKYQLPPTSIQLKSIISSLQKIQTQQLKIRDQLDALLRLPLLPGEHFLKIDFGKIISFEVVLNKPRRAETLKNYLVKKLHVTEMRVNGNILKVKCQR